MILSLTCWRGCVKRNGCNCILQQNNAIELCDDDCDCVRKIHHPHWQHTNDCSITPIYAQTVRELGYPLISILSSGQPL